jgi:hypothetical protein
LVLSRDGFAKPETSWRTAVALPADTHKRAEQAPRYAQVWWRERI